MKIVRGLFIVCFNIICILSFCFNENWRITANAYESVYASISVEGMKISDNNSHTYEIVIESLDNSAPAPESDIIIITGSGIGAFNVEITEPGTYDYKIYEIPGSDKNVIYDDSVYYATVFVENAEDNSLKYSVSVKEENSDHKSDNVVFTNVSSSNNSSSDSSSHTSSSSDDSHPFFDPSNPSTGDNASLGLMALILLVLPVLIIIELKKKDKEGGQ